MRSSIRGILRHTYELASANSNKSERVWYLVEYKITRRSKWRVFALDWITKDVNIEIRTSYWFLLLLPLGACNVRLKYSKLNKE